MWKTGLAGALLAAGTVGVALTHLAWGNLTHWSAWLVVPAIVGTGMAGGFWPFGLVVQWAACTVVVWVALRAARSTRPGPPAAPPDPPPSGVWVPPDAAAIARVLRGDGPPGPAK